MTSFPRRSRGDHIRGEQWWDIGKTGAMIPRLIAEKWCCNNYSDDLTELYKQSCQIGVSGMREVQSIW